MDEVSPVVLNMPTQCSLALQTEVVSCRIIFLSMLPELVCYLGKDQVH